MAKLIRVGRTKISSKVALKVVEEAKEYVLSRPDVDSVVILVGSPGLCRPFMTPIDNPLGFIGMLEWTKQDLFREN